MAGVAQDQDYNDQNAINELCALLAIDTHHLQVGNEMRRLFGRAAAQAEEEEMADARRAHLGNEMGLAAAVSGKNAYGGPGLPAMLRRRNIFIHGREDWPRSTGNGLTMEIVESKDAGVVEYRFVHSAAYQQAQSEFESCVQSMDPMRMVNSLRFNRKPVPTTYQQMC